MSTARDEGSSPQHQRPAPAWWSSSRVAWLGGAFIAVIAALAAYDMLRSYRETVAQTERELDVQARVIAEQTTRSLQAVDTVLRHLAEQHRRGVLQRLSPDELHAYLKEQAVGLVQVDGLVVFGPDGRGRGSSVIPPQAVGRLDVTKLETFYRLREEARIRMMVGTTIRAPGTGRRVFPIGRRLDSADGQFAGVVGAGGQVEYFQRFYRDAYPDPGTRIALLHRNTTLMAQHPPDDDALGRKFPPLAGLIAQAASGVTVSRRLGPVDSVDRFAAMRPVPDHPLLVLVTRDAATALAPWRAQAIGSSARTLALGAMAVLLIVMVQRQLARVAAARASLEESEERFATAVAGSDDGIWMFDYAKGEAFASRRAQDIIGLPQGNELMSIDEGFARMAQQLHPEDLPRRNQALQDHVAGRTPAYAGEYRVRLPDGGYRWIRTHGKCVFGRDGKPLRIAGSVSDIDARKRAEAALRESEERYALAMTGSDEGHWLWDLRAGQVYVSARLAELFGFEGGAQTMRDSDYFAAIPLHPDDRERVHHSRKQHVAGLTPRLDHEFRIVLPASGEQRWMHTRAQCFRDDDGQPLRMAGSTVDITSRKRAEAEHQRLEEQLRQAQKLEAIGTLAGGIAHDFNNILSAILGYGELAQKGAAAGSAQRRHIDAAIAAGQRAKSLVERILAFSRSGIGERVPVHVQSVVDEALDAVAATLPRGVQLIRRLAAGDAGVLGDATQIHQVVMNLCANAVQAMNSQGRLGVSLDTLALAAPLVVATNTLPPGDYLRLEVADSGSGIAPALLARIFDPFFTTKQVGVGTGLGLSLVHGIVTDLGGGIAVDSKEGVGSRFTVYLPSRQVVAGSKAQALDSTEIGSGQSVLLVDDEEPLVRLGEEILAGIGYEPVGFTSAAAALAALQAEPARFDALLSDEAMPGMTGSELVRAVRALRPDLPVVLMSGYVTPGLVQRAREAGIAEVLAKPLVAADIARALAAALRALPSGAR